MNIAAYPKYDSYQEVKISWCEELPSHWTTQPIRNLFTESRRKNGDGKNKDYLSLMANRGIIPYSEKGDVGNKMPADLSGCKLVDVDDFVLNSMNFGIGSFGVSSLKGVCSSVYVILKANNPASIKYYERIFQHPQFQTFSQSLGNGILAHRCAIGWDELKNAHFPVPPVEEIQAIAAFLDGKCATIDEAVRIKEEQIRLLAERRQILIQEAVTRGLNPDAPMKDSGIDWIGQIPAHWSIEKLGSMLTAVSEKNRPDLPLLSITREQGVIERDVEDQDSNHNFIPDDLSGYKVLREGQFGMNKMKAWQGSYGVSAHTGIVSPAYFIFGFARKVDPHFFNIAIRSKLYVSYFGSASDGVRIGQWDLNQSRMRQIPMLLPPLPEQRAIAEFLDGKCATIDEAISLKESQITALREYKTSLINAAVTGKIKVL